MGQTGSSQRRRQIDGYGAIGRSVPPHLYIVADDLGWEDAGFHGSDIKTPNIEKLAQDGARLEQFYAQPISGMPASANRLLADERRSATCSLS